LARQVDLPDIRGKTPDAALPIVTGALGNANANIGATHDCQADQRGRLAGGH
jgi:hypothetical protein